MDNKKAHEKIFINIREMYFLLNFVINMNPAFKKSFKKK